LDLGDNPTSLSMLEKCLKKNKLACYSILE